MSAAIDTGISGLNKSAGGISAAVIVAEILEIVTELSAARPDAAAVVFWDFDGTLLEGDCSEGWRRPDGSGYAGLVETAINRGFSRAYPAEGGWLLCLRDYIFIMEREGQAAAYAFFAQVFESADPSELTKMSRRYFAEILRPWLFPEALEIQRALEAAGVRCAVISASADFFVKGASAVLNVPEERLEGIRLRLQKDGSLSGEIRRPLTQGNGKAERMREMLKEMQEREPHHTFWPVAAFGNSVSTDGPLLEAVASWVLPAGKPVSFLVNAASSTGRFREIIFNPASHAFHPS